MGEPKVAKHGMLSNVPKSSERVPNGPKWLFEQVANKGPLLQAGSWHGVYFSINVYV